MSPMPMVQPHRGFVQVQTVAPSCRSSDNGIISPSPQMWQRGNGLDMGGADCSGCTTIVCYGSHCTAVHSVAGIQRRIVLDP